MGKSEATLLWAVIIILFFCNIIIPYVAVAFNQAYTSHNLNEANPDTPEDLTIGDLVTLGGFSLLLIPFWTISAPALMQFFLLIPLRIFGWVLFFRLFRGVG